MAKLAVTSVMMIQISFLVMNLEHLLTQGVFSWLVSWWQSCLSPVKDRLVAQGNTMHADFRDRSACGIEFRGARIILLAA